MGSRKLNVQVITFLNYPTYKVYYKDLSLIIETPILK
jgi:hypothetical protein